MMKGARECELESQDCLSDFERMCYSASLLTTNQSKYSEKENEIRDCCFSVHPVQFFRFLLKDRDYDFTDLNAMEIRGSSSREPSLQQLHDYESDLLTAIRNSDVPGLRTHFLTGKSMSACNRYSESVLHIACRRSELAVVDFVLCNGGQADLIDDYGRTPLHDAFWRPEPHFAIVELLMERNVDLMRYADIRGSIPLHYTRKEHWAEWCGFLYTRRDKFWPIKTNPPNRIIH